MILRVRRPPPTEAAKEAKRLRQRRYRAKDPERARARNRRSRLRHREREVALKRLAYERGRAVLYLFKMWTPCFDCGTTFHPAAMQYDHRPGEKKLFQLSVAHTRNRARFEAERKKCDLVCANCHAVRTYERVQQRLN